MTYKIGSIILVLLFISCNKNKPKVGDYQAHFNYSYIDTNDAILTGSFSLPVYILATNKENIYLTTGNLNATSLQKEKKNPHIVSGILYVDTTIDSNLTNIETINLNGCWEKTKDEYSISGFFNFLKLLPDNNGYVIDKYNVLGTFEIKPN